MPDPLESWLPEALANLDHRGLRRTLSERKSPQRGDRIEINGQSLINFGSNDYLGLAADPRIIAAARAALDEYGWGSGASPLVTGRTSLHAELEKKLAEFMGTEAALLFPSGYAANVGAITALVGKGDVIFSDELNHASIIDGCRLSGAKIHIYRHADTADLADQLRRNLDYRRRLIVSESLFSMTGDFAPLDDLATLAESAGAILLVDEAHAIGVFGHHGSGLCEQLNVNHRGGARVGTLSKALGSVGGFVVGSQRIIDWLLNRARPYVFSTALPASAAAAASAALAIIQSEPDCREQLLASAARLRESLSAVRLPISSGKSQIVSLIVGDPSRAVAISAALRDRGFFVPAIRPPSVPDGQSLLRVSLTCLHTPDHLSNLVAALSDIAR